MRSVTNVLAAVFLATTLTVSLSGFASAVHPEEAQRVEATQQANEATTVPLLKPRTAPTWHDYGSRYQWICYLQYDVTSMSKCRGGTLVIWDKTLKKEASRMFIPNSPAAPANVNWYCVASGASFVLSLPGQPASVGGWILKASIALLGAIGIKGSCP